MSTDIFQLKTELRQAGAKSWEVDELANIATGLSELKVEHARKILKPSGALRFALPAVISIFVTAIVIVSLAQSVLPTSWLYPVQKFSDNVAITIHPQYRATVMMRTARQVKELVSSNAPSSAILSTLVTYNKVATVYGAMPGANYAAFNYCKINLELAAVSAPVKVRQAINNSLNSLETT